MWQRLKRFSQPFLSAFDKWSSDSCSVLAASMAYYFALTLFPILFLLLSAVGVFLEHTNLGRDAKSQLLSAVGEQVSPELEMQIQSVLEQVSDQAGVGGPLGVLMLLIASAGAFIQLDYAFVRIWKLDEDSSSGVWKAVKEVVFARAKAFLMLLALGAVLFTIFISGFILSALENHLVERFRLPEQTVWWIELAMTIITNACVFTLLYRYVPRAAVPWSAAIKGGLVATAIWEVGRQAMAIYMVRSDYGSAYGVLGSFLAIMLWAYFGAAVILYGAEFAYVSGSQAKQGR